MIKNIKISAVILAVIMSLSFASCTASFDDNSKSEPKSETQTQSAAKKPKTKKTVADGKDVLVAYFSATGTTKGVAENGSRVNASTAHRIWKVG